ncbi:hypothetical protein ABB37_06402 [Leptomonas pyrrhocoris]|uniref:Uncharacterized protein n=1 Tax=Leptomonas pyrrhocoris TaxID=157538 RepID=A0A0M9FY08_LEPPY|nr:hypothetical protein ABB37_06402 [Leptomonas pyrrhocoris]KPA78249.1 hypothetical protein ABB37_06402 [Leptomonas pyrrhocoris]|eukprot:XP_015656688.1 hypothetical protein ABB37_06402 [Leptomonas pyrrhocoris]
MGEEETSYAAVEALAITTLAVHNALHSFRHVAFSSMAGPPLPPHRSWHPLWAAYRSHLLRSPHTAPSPGVLAETTSAGKTAGGDTAAAASTARLMDPAAVQRKFGEAKPLFGAAGRGTFFLVAIPPTEEDGDAADASAPSSYAASGAEHVHLSHRRHHDSRAAAVGLAGVPSSSSKTPPSSVSSLWECFRVDAYVPASVQMQAAVRHLLRERRPRSMYQPETVDKEGIPIDQRNPVKLSARPLAVIALVVPDTLVGAYTAFLQRLEHERADVRGRTGGGSVQLLLFNSAELVRVCHAA